MITFSHSNKIFLNSKVNKVSVSVSTDTAKIVACAIVASQLDYCNALLAWMSESNLDKLQCVQTPSPASSLDYVERTTLHQPWRSCTLLPIRDRITFKVATVVYRLRKRQQPLYLAHLISDYIPTRTLRSSTKTLLAESSFWTNIGRRSFRYVAAKTLNNLPDDIKTVDSLILCRKYV